MEKLLPYRETTLSYILYARSKILLGVQNLFGVDEVFAQRIIVYLLAYLVVIFIFSKIVSRLKNKANKKLQLYTREIDTLLYDVQTQLFNYNKTATQAIQASFIRDILTAEKKEYLANQKLISDWVQSIQSQLGAQILGADRETKILKLAKKYQTTKKIQKFFGFILAVLTIWISLILGR